MVDCDALQLRKRGLWGCHNLRIETYRPEQPQPAIEANILQQAASLLPIQDLELITPYVPCHNLIISINQLPEESWLISFFKRLLQSNETNQIQSLTLTGPIDQPNRMYTMSHEAFIAIAYWITSLSGANLQRLIIRQMCFTERQVNALKKTLQLKQVQ